MNKGNYATEIYIARYLVEAIWLSWRGVDGKFIDFC